MKKFEINVDGKDYNIDIEKYDGKKAVVNVNGKSYAIDVKKAAAAVFSSQAPPTLAHVAPQPSTPGPTAGPVASAPASGQIVAPMPGLILEVMVSEGDTVTAGTPVAKIEAMKMENEIPAPENGTVKEIHIKKGDRVATDEVLMTIG